MPTSTPGLPTSSAILPPSGAPLPTASAASAQRRDAVAWALGIGVAIVAAVTLFALAARAAGQERGDFEAYYSGAWAIRQGTSLYVRALAWQRVGFANKYPGPEPVEGSTYVYPPIFAIALVPFSLMSLHAAGLVWEAVTVFCLLGTAYVLIGLLFPALNTWPRVLPAVLGLGALIALYQPARSILFTGQVDAVLLLLMALTLAAFVYKQDKRAAIFLALAMAIKPAAGFIILYLLWKRAYRAAILSAGLGAALVFLPFAVLGPQAAADALATTLYWSGPLFGVSPVNQSPYGLALRLFVPNAYTVPVVEAPWLPLVVRAVVTVATLGLLATTISRSRTMPTHRLALEYGLAIVGLLLVSPLSEDNHYLYLAIPFIATMAVLLTQPTLRGRAALGGLLVMALVYLSLPTLNALDNAFYAYYVRPVAWPWVLLTGMHLYGLGALAAVMLVVARRYRTSFSGDRTLTTRSAHRPLLHTRSTLS